MRHLPSQKVLSKREVIMYIDQDMIKRARHAQLKALESGRAKKPQELSENKELQEAFVDFKRNNSRRKNKVSVI
jgi:hypothetical protein